MSSLQKKFPQRYCKNRLECFLPTLCRDHSERTALPISLSCSMTVEAAVLIPLLLFFFLNLMSAVEILRLHGNIQYALWKYGRLISVSGYAYDHLAQGEMITGPGGVIVADYGVAHAIRKELGETYMKASPLKFGENGLNLLESDYITGDCVDIKLTYQVEPMFPVPGFRSFRMANRYSSRMWTGYEVYSPENAVMQEVAYVTDYGEVYHITLTCRYLERTVSELTLNEAMMQKNMEGGYYTVCMQCKDQREKRQDELPEMDGIVYVTRWGGRYHYSLECSGLKRTIQTVEKSTAKKDYPPCSSCAMVE